MATAKERRPFWKKLKHHLTVWDGIISGPIGIALFFAIGLIGQAIFGRAVGFYDPSIWQTVFLAIAIFFIFNNFVALALYFNFRPVFRYFYGFMKDDATVVNKSKDDAGKLTPWQRLIVSLFIYVFYSLQLVVIYSILL